MHTPIVLQQSIVSQQSFFKKGMHIQKATIKVIETLLTMSYDLVSLDGTMSDGESSKIINCAGDVLS